MSKRYCLICRKEAAEGTRVAMDPLISFVLWAKMKVGISNSKGRAVVVCRHCMPNYGKSWARFRGKAIQLGLLAFVVFCVQAYFVNLLVGAVFALFLLSFLLIYYVPRLEKEGKPQEPARAV